MTHYYKFVYESASLGTILECPECGKKVAYKTGQRPHILRRGTHSVTHRYRGGVDMGISVIVKRGTHVQ